MRLKLRLLDLPLAQSGNSKPLGAFVLSLAAAATYAAPASIDLPGERAYPESVSSSSDGTLYVGNTADGGIVRIPPNGRPERWLKAGTFGSRSVLGVLVDEPSNTLWICSNNLSSSGVPLRGAAAGSALIGLDLKTGAGKVHAPFAGEHNFCNDMAVGADGSVYVTNSDAPQILKLAPHAKQLSVWFSNPSLRPAPNGYGLDGIAFGNDGNLYFNRFDAADLYRLNILNGHAGTLTKLKPSRKLALTDAMRPLGPGMGPANFLLIEGEGRLDMLSIEGDDARITTLHDGYVTPTGVTRVGDVAWVCEGQLDFLADPANKPRLPFKLYSVPLPR